MLVYAYQNTGGVLHNLHPIVALGYVGVIGLLALAMSQPLHLVMLFLCGLATLLIVGRAGGYWGYFRFAFRMTVALVVINALVNTSGNTVIFYRPYLPLLGSGPVTMEAVVYSLTMGMRLLGVLMASCLFNELVNPDSVVKMFGQIAGKTGMMIILGLRFFPVMAEEMERIGEMQRARGFNLDKGSIIQRLQNRIVLLQVLLVSALERSWQVAEAMHSRGFATGKRSCYHWNPIRPRDYLVAVGSSLALVSGVWQPLADIFSGGDIIRHTVLFGPGLFCTVSMCTGLLIPCFLAWGWKRWPSFGQKI